MRTRDWPPERILTYLRERLRLTQRELADLLHIEVRTMYGWTHEGRKPHARTLRKLHELLKTTLAAQAHEESEES